MSRGMRRVRPMRTRVLRSGSAAAMLTFAVACADFEAPPSPDETLPDVVVAQPTLSEHVQPIFTARCATSSCHTAVTHQANMILETPQTYESIVDQRSVLRPNLWRVRPGYPDSSMIALAVGPNPPIVRMPLGQPPLTENQIQTIRNWIARGAPR